MNESYLKELLLCMNELFTLLHFTPHLLHLILIGLPWYHIFISLQLILHFRSLENKLVVLGLFFINSII